MRAWRASEDVELADIAKSLILGRADIFSERELANRVRLMARRVPEFGAFLAETRTS